MDISIFTDKAHVPKGKDLLKALGDTAKLWQETCSFVHRQYPSATEEWKFPGEKHGWSFRIKDKKRVIIYLLPGDRYFRVALVFGQKAYEAVMAAKISQKIKTELDAARVYAEGRGIRIDVKNEKDLKDINRLIEIKIAH